MGWNLDSIMYSSFLFLPPPFFSVVLPLFRHFPFIPFPSPTSLSALYRRSWFVGLQVESVRERISFLDKCRACERDDCIVGDYDMMGSWISFKGGQGFRRRSLPPHRILAPSVGRGGGSSSRTSQGGELLKTSPLSDAAPVRR